MARPLAPPEVIDAGYYAEHGYPHEAWRKLRAEQPVAWCEAEGYPAFWAITKHADIVEISKHPERFQNAPMMAVFPREQYEAESFPFRHLINMDPPEHRAYRRILSQYFTPRGVKAQAENVERVVAGCFERLRDRDRIDFVEDFSAVMAIEVIADMLGIPQADRPDFFHWTNLIIAGSDPEYQGEQSTREAVAGAVEAQFDYFRKMVEARRREPTEDLTSVLANAQIDGEPIPEWELLSYLALIVVAGNETTRNAASGGLLALMESPEQMQKLRGDPELVPLAVEEMLRWVTPVNQMVRTPNQDCEIRGQRIRAGEPLCLFYASANRDEEVFEDPFSFRVDRSPNPHIAFGIGEHVCMGAHLARLELTTLFRELLRRVEQVEVAGPVPRQRSSFVGGIKHLPIRYRLSGGGSP